VASTATAAAATSAQPQLACKPAVNVPSATAALKLLPSATWKLLASA
jgi:hypothetical protein